MEKIFHCEKKVEAENSVANKLEKYIDTSFVLTVGQIWFCFMKLNHDVPKNASTNRKTANDVEIDVVIIYHTVITNTPIIQKSGIH